jgi:hypothetical protein
MAIIFSCCQNTTHFYIRPTTVKCLSSIITSILLYAIHYDFSNLMWYSSFMPNIFQLCVVCVHLTDQKSKIAHTSSITPQWFLSILHDFTAAPSWAWHQWSPSPRTPLNWKPCLAPLNLNLMLLEWRENIGTECRRLAWYNPTTYHNSMQTLKSEIWCSKSGEARKNTVYWNVMPHDLIVHI